MSPDDHEGIEELIAGYALEALSGADAEAAEALLAEHVPGCLRCRRLMEEYRAVAGDLALAVEPADAPETVLPALRRAIAEDRDRGAGRIRRGVPAWIGAAAAVALLTMGGVTAVLTQRIGDADQQRAAAENAITLMSDPATRVLSLRGAVAGSDADVAYKPGQSPCYLVVKDIPRPRRNHPYEVWVTVDGVPARLVGTFLHRRSTTIVEMPIDLTGYDGIWIVEARENPTGVPADPVMTATV
ncbi:MAG: anti-sigma factor [Actinomycetota bacterium]